LQHDPAPPAADRGLSGTSAPKGVLSGRALPFPTRGRYHLRCARGRRPRARRLDRVIEPGARITGHAAERR
jgi:hypothetical protein